MKASWHPFLVAAIAAGVAIAVQAQIGPRDYPQWRGLNRDGGASAFVEPKSWPAQLTQRWKADVGEGYATPLVVGNVVYAFTRREGREVMTALNSGSGKQIWQSGTAVAYTPSKATAAHGSGPKATPAFHQGRLFTVGITGIVSGFDAKSGKLLWQTEPPVEPPFFSAASSPAADGGLVLAHPGNYGPLTAFDAATGRVKWTVEGDGLFASPIIVELAGTRQVVSVLQESIVGVSLPDGRVLWRHPWRAPAGSVTPLIHRDTIIVSGMDAGVVSIRPRLQNGTWSVEKVWETKEVSMYMSNPVVAGDALFGLSHRASGQFFALDADTGRVLWLGQPREAANTAVVKAGPLIFLLNDDAELIVARSSRAGFEAVKRYTVAESATWAQPAISGNRIFIKDASTLALWTID